MGLEQGAMTEGNVGAAIGVSSTAGNPRLSCEEGLGIELKMRKIR
jgi:hypothetical protein